MKNLLPDVPKAHSDEVRQEQVAKIKKLNRDYTTPEQSKRLLELGVPADSADCFYTPMYEIFHDSNRPHVRTRGHEVASSFFSVRPDYLPCWSVGRLAEIYTKCMKETETFSSHIILHKGWTVDNIVDIITEDIKLGCMDFSKLEE